MKYLFFFITLSLTLSLTSSCGDAEPLPILNRANEVDGKKVYEKIRDFSFVNQDSVEVTNKTFQGRVYISNYFFTTCPTICPTVTGQMVRIFESFEKDNRVRLLSHSIDTKTDTVATLKRYAEGLEVEAPKWNFVTGDLEKLEAIAFDYFTNAFKDPEAEGGYDHDDIIVVIDKDRHIRAYCHGQQPEEVSRFIKDVEHLLKTEY